MLEPSFFDVLMEAKKHQLHIKNNLDKELKRFEALLKKASVMDKEYIRDMYYDDLLKLKHTMTSSPEFRGYHDRIIKNHFKLDKNAPKGITLLFEQFIKGVTYFAYQKNNANDIPIYHRLYSCGDGTELYRGDHMICVQGISRIERNRRKKLIERCYIDRLIYDALYKHETLHFPSQGTDEASQDNGHMFRLDITKQDYESCFKDCVIGVEIEYADNMPILLRIKRSKQGIETSIEEYRKTYSFDTIGNKIYEPLVECSKSVGHRVYYKVQTFLKETDFKARVP
jgi:hypothetical protein